MPKLDNIKQVLHANIEDAMCGLFGFAGKVRPFDEILYEQDDVKVLISHDYEYFVILGLTDEEFYEIKKYYHTLRRLVFIQRQIAYKNECSR